MATTNADPDSFGDRGPLLRWLVFTGLCVLPLSCCGAGLIRQMVASDRTYLSSIIGLLYGGVDALPVAYHRDLARGRRGPPRWRVDRSRIGWPER